MTSLKHLQYSCTNSKLLECINMDVHGIISEIKVIYPLEHEETPSVLLLFTQKDVRDGARKESIRKKSNGKKETIFARIKSNRKKSNSTKFI